MRKIIKRVSFMHPEYGRQVLDVSPQGYVTYHDGSGYKKLVHIADLAKAIAHYDVVFETIDNKCVRLRQGGDGAYLTEAAAMLDAYKRWAD